MRTGFSTRPRKIRRKREVSGRPRLGPELERLLSSDVPSRGGSFTPPVLQSHATSRLLSQWSVGEAPPPPVLHSLQCLR